MGVTRRIIFPTIRLILWAVIAAALVKIAFAGADVSTVDTSLQPTGADRRADRRRSRPATVTNAVTVQASVDRGPAPSSSGPRWPARCRSCWPPTAPTVAAGTPILEIRQETPQDPLVTDRPGRPASRPPPSAGPRSRSRRSRRPSPARCRCPRLKDQVVSVGDEVGNGRPRHAVRQRAP